MSPRLLLISTDHPPMRGGIARVMEHLCLRLDSEELRVLARDHAEARKEPNVIRLPFEDQASRFEKVIQFFFWLVESIKQIRKRSIRIVVIGLLSPMGILGPILKVFLGIRYVIFAYASEIPLQNSFFLRRWIARLIYDWSLCTFCISRYAQSRVKSIAPLAPCAIIPLGVDSHRFKARPKNPKLIDRYGLQGKRVLLCLGRLVKRKGYDRAIEAFSQAFKGRDDVVLLIAGDGPNRDDLAKLAMHLGVEKGVRFIGMLDEHELTDIYNLAEIFLFLARDEGGDAEGFGLVILEAQACGCAVIGGRSGAIPDVIDDGITGVLVDSGNVSEIAVKLRELFENEALLNKLKAQGKAYAQAQTWESSVTQVKRILESMTDQGSADGK